MQDKRMSLKDAISTYVADGCTLAFGSILVRESCAASHEIIRQKKKDLYFVCQSSSDSAEMLIGAGCIKKLEAPYLWMALAGSSPNYRRAVEEGIPHHIETKEYSNLTMAMRFQAGAMGIPFMPTKSLIGTDVLKANQDIKVMDDPFGSGQIALIPAVQPDVAIIHVQRADMYGNSQLWGVTMSDSSIARAAKKVIITCEEIIPTSEIRKIPNMTAIPSYCVDAVVEVPFGSYPNGLAGYYWMDMPFRKVMAESAKTREGFLKWLEEWIYNLDDFSQFVEKVGKDRLNKLRIMEQENCVIPDIVVNKGVI